MINLPIEFKQLAQVFKDHGYNAYLIGGSSRDCLLNKEFKDFDVATNATPEEVISMFEDVFDHFKQYGSVRVTYKGTKFDVTTFRKETKYTDHRHPGVVEYTTDIKEDYYRRDFTINAIYIDMDGNIYDFGSGSMDLQYNLIRMIGDPNKRLKEDPLRILRAIRFSLVLDFEVEESLQFALKRNAYLIQELNEGKIKEEIAKMKKAGIPEVYIKGELSKYHVVLPFKLAPSR